MQTQINTIKRFFPTRFIPALVINPLRVQQIQTEKTAIDSDITELSSVKLLSILRLHNVEGCRLEESFIKEVQMELQRRGCSQEWHLPPR